MITPTAPASWALSALSAKPQEDPSALAPPRSISAIFPLTGAQLGSEGAVKLQPSCTVGVVVVAGGDVVPPTPSFTQTTSALRSKAGTPQPEGTPVAKSPFTPPETNR